MQRVFDVVMFGVDCGVFDWLWLVTTDYGPLQKEKAIYYGYSTLSQYLAGTHSHKCRTRLLLLFLWFTVPAKCVSAHKGYTAGYACNVHKKRNIWKHFYALMNWMRRKISPLRITCTYPWSTSNDRWNLRLWSRTECWLFIRYLSLFRW